MDTHLGQQMGNYHLIRLLGKGGFANVYLGEHIHLNTKAAIKVLQLRLVGSNLEQFRIEARTIAGLTHDNIVRILDFGVQDETPYLVMDYAPYGSLRQRHPRGSILTPSQVVPYVKQVAAALQYAHNQKLIHRDIKPENILLGVNNNVLLSDFGLVLIAQSTGSQTLKEMAGTVPYMAPEQLQGKPRPASDQYALGIVIYEWLSGDRPFSGSFAEIASQHMFTDPPSLREINSGVSPALQKVIFTALAKEPQRRFVNVQQFAEAYEKAILGPNQSYHTLPTMTFTTKPDQSLISTFVKGSQEESVQIPSESQPGNQISQTLRYDNSLNQTSNPKTVRSTTNQSSQSAYYAYPDIDSNEQIEESRQIKGDDWMNLKWFILLSAILAPLLFSVGFFFQIPTVTAVSFIPAVICLILGLLETGHFNQWYWFVGFLLLSPLTGVIYGVINPESQPIRPINLKQLIIILSCLGYALLPVAFAINSWSQASTGLIFLAYYLSLGFILSGWLLGLIRAIRLFGASEDIFLTFFFPLTAPFAALIFAFAKSENRKPEDQSISDQEIP